MLSSLGEDLRKLVLAGIGSVAMTVEKSKELIDELVKKGELTIEQGKVLNEELKHNIRENIKKNITVNINSEKAASLIDNLDKLTPEELSALKQKLADMEKKDESNGNG